MPEGLFKKKSIVIKRKKGQVVAIKEDQIETSICITSLLLLSNIRFSKQKSQCFQCVFQGDLHNFPTLPRTTGT